MIDISNIITVGQLNSYIKNMFTEDYLLQSVCVKGEVSNCKYHPSGHIYFTLKDPRGTVNCVMFASYCKGLSFALKDGQSIVVTGSVDIYEKTGSYQLYAKSIVLEGSGVLYEKYLALKNELEELGMFDAQYKRPIPKYIKTLGVVTANSGAAVRDIIQISTRRNPYVQIILYPAIVQGEYAAASIVEGIKTLEKEAVDVIIVGRGGGSIEDLWAFNERVVAQAVFDCSIPIISAVGHETDFTITDFVADLRASTPSAAAELAVCDINDIFRDLEVYRSSLDQAMLFKLKNLNMKLENYSSKINLLSPMSKLQKMRLELENMSTYLHQNMKEVLFTKKHELEILASKVDGLSPLKKLKSGFSFVENKSRNDKNVKQVSDVEKDDELKIFVSDGYVLAKTFDRKVIENLGE